MSRIGFALLTHSKPHQIQRLVTRLNTMFDSPPIVIHHDFGKCALPVDAFPGNVSFVQPHVTTGWGTLGSVEAMVRAVTDLHGRPDAPDWSALLSGACYPVKPAAQILAELDKSPYDLYLNGRRVGRDALDSEWLRERYDRYCVRKFRVPSVDKRLRPKMRTLRVPHQFGRHWLPFSENLHCYAGIHWFTANRRAVQYLIDFQQTASQGKLADYLRGLPFADETYFQTVFYNASQLNIQYTNLRYMDWSEHELKPTGHPKQLTLADFAAIQASGAHFARKIDLDSDPDLLDALDRIIDGSAAVPPVAASAAH